MELVAELRGRDGRARCVRVPYPAAEGEGRCAQLRAARRALAELQERLAQLLAPLAREEREAAGGGPGGDAEEEEEEEQESEDENGLDGKASGDDPPPKRTKVQEP